MAGLTQPDGPPADSRSFCFNRLSSPGQDSAALAELTPRVPGDRGLSLLAHWPVEA